MAKLATCPGCTTQLALPEEATLSDEARCPRCGEEFPLMEVVQFSIPTAELIPASERGPSSEIAEWAAKSTERELPEESPPEEAISDAVQTEEEEMEPTASERPDADQTATLSDWEARLKRAISDTEPEAPEAIDSSEHESDSPASFEVESQPEVKLSDTLNDFSFPHEDLEPVSRAAPLRPAQQSEAQIEPPPTSASWMAAETDEFDFDTAEPTVKTTADTTISERIAPSEPDVEIDTTTSSAPRQKPRSFSRTMLSASLGVVGIPLGLYALLWIKGPAADVAHMADYLPSSMLPASMQATPNPLEENASALAQEDSDPLPGGDGQTIPPLVADSKVQPASAEVPVYNGPRFALVESEEFGQLLAAASRAVPELAAGDFADPASKKRKGHAYIALCQLADKCSFMNQPGLSAEDARRVSKAKGLMESISTDPDIRADLPLIAEPWWKYQARPSSGIVLTGRVERVEEAAVGLLAMIRLGETETIVPVLLSGGDTGPESQIGIVGTIVNDPSAQIPALSEVSEPIVVGHFSVAIESSGTVDGS